MSDNVEKWREEFEEWFTGGDDKIILKKDGVGNYTYMAAYTSWKAWLAAKQSHPVVELPARRAGYNTLINLDKVVDILEKANILHKIKGE